MAADVSRQIKSEPKSGLITRDFLGRCFGIESKELDLDLHVPSGWEKRLDLKSGKVYIQRCNPENSPSEQRNPANQICPKFQDIINPNPQSPPLSMLTSNQNPTLILLEDTSLDLKLVSNCAPSSYTSVCTLDKVKSALDRAERASTTSSSSSSKRRWVVPTLMGSPTKSSSLLSNSSSMSVKEVYDEEERLSSRAGDRNGLLVATACPGCLLYVLISKSDPKCPKCNSVVQLPMEAKKKPNIDLNMSI